jgi:hypothetical protein
MDKGWSLSRERRERDREGFGGAEMTKTAYKEETGVSSFRSASGGQKEEFLFCRFSF